jgi:hypothetical protein
VALSLPAVNALRSAAGQQPVTELGPVFADLALVMLFLAVILYLPLGLAVSAVERTVLVQSGT